MKKQLLIISSLLITVFFVACGSNSPVNSVNGPGNTDTSFAAYVIITPTGGVPDTLFFTDRNFCSGSYSSSQNNTYCQIADTVTHNNSAVTFTGNTTGSPAFTFGDITYNGNGLTDTSISGTVTLYEAVGGKIKGTFSGTYTGGSIAYQVSGVFTVKRTQ